MCIVSQKFCFHCQLLNLFIHMEIRGLCPVSFPFERKGSQFWFKVVTFKGMFTSAHTLCQDNCQLIVLAINCNHSVSKNNCN